MDEWLERAWMHYLTSKERREMGLLIVSPGVSKPVLRRRAQTKVLTEGLTMPPDKFDLTFRNNGTKRNPRVLHWPAGTNGRGEKVTFCYTTAKNRAGYFVGFQQTMKKGGALRTGWVARRKRNDLKWLMYNRAEAFKAQYEQVQS